jgi:hypothetical protein
MICRVMLNLHETAAIENDEDAAATHPEPLQFARSIGTDPQEMSVF